MPPLTLAVLASVLHMQGADATITSDNKGIEDVLAGIRGQLQEQADQQSPRIIEAAVATHHKGYYSKTYTKYYMRYNVGAKPSGGSPGKPTGGTAIKPEGGTHR